MCVVMKKKKSLNVNCVDVWNTSMQSEIVLTDMTNAAVKLHYRTFGGPNFLEIKEKNSWFCGNLSTACAQTGQGYSGSRAFPENNGGEVGMHPGQTPDIKIFKEFSDNDNDQVIVREREKNIKWHH